MTENPQASSGDEVQAIISLKGQSRAPDVVDVGPGLFAVGPVNQGLYAKYYNTRFKTVPRAMKDGRGFWTGDYWGVMAFGTNQEHRRQAADRLVWTSSAPASTTRSR